MSDIQVLFMGQDLYKLGYVTSIPAIHERKTFKRDKIGDNSFTLKCKNYNNMFSIGHKVSMLTGTNWLYQSLKIINEDDITTWDGIVTNIKQDQRSKEVYIETKDTIFKSRNLIIEYESSDWETLATAAKNIMTNYSFTNYSEKTINESINQLTDETCLVKVNYNKSSRVTLIQALEDLGEKSCSDVFSHYGNIYFKHYQPYTGGVSLNLNVDKSTRLLTNPIINYLEPQMINQYSIDYDGSSGIPQTDSDSTGIGIVSRNKYGIRELSPFNTGTGEQVVFKDSVSTKYIGECFLNMTHHDLSTQPQPIIKIQFDVDIKFKYYIDLENYFKLTLTDNDWEEKVFEVFEFRRNEDARKINIVAYGVNT